MNAYFSKKIKILSFFAIIGVVFCHAYNYYNRFLQPTTVIAEGTTPGAMLQFFISNGLVRFGVPIFFIFSGYLFFHQFEFSWKGYLKKVGKRIKTLVVPYLIWTALAGTFLYFVYMCVGLERYSIVWEKVGAMLEYGIVTWLFSSPAFQLWFVMDLFKLVILSPVLYLLVKKLKWIPIVLFGILWVLEIHYVINAEALLFFSLGAYWAVHKLSITGMTELSSDSRENTKYKKITKLFAFLWVAGCFIYALCSASMGQYPYIPYVLLILYKVNVISGIVAVWRLYDLNAKWLREKRWLQVAASHTFMVYVLHEPMQHLFTDMCLEKWQFNGAHTMVYFLLPVVMICFCVVVGILLKKVCPKVHSVLTGGRG